MIRLKCYCALNIYWHVDDRPETIEDLHSSVHGGAESSSNFYIYDQPYNRHLHSDYPRVKNLIEYTNLIVLNCKCVRCNKDISNRGMLCNSCEIEESNLKRK